MARAAPYEAALVDPDGVADVLVTVMPVVIDTGATPPTLGDGSTVYTGTVTAAGEALFVFSELELTDVTVRGARPLVLLTHGDLTLRGHVDGDADGVGPGPGGGDAGRTSGASGTGDGPGSATNAGAGGGGHGGVGGDGGVGGAVANTGGVAYGDLSMGVLSAGSGGARTNGSGMNGVGGSGGGAMELGAGGVLALDAAAVVSAVGSPGLFGTNDGGGGGSGGAVLLHGKTGSGCVNGASIDVRGGAGGSADDDPGGGGGGGRIQLYGVPSTDCLLLVDGGAGGFRGAMSGEAGQAGVWLASDPDLDADLAPYSTDCDDQDGLRSPVFEEVPGTGVDEDCDGFETCWSDADGDGYTSPDPVVSDDSDCTDATEETVATETDCDDLQASRYPTAPELCDGVDQNCDDVPDDGLAQASWYLDNDGDGFGDPITETLVCGSLSIFVDNGDDCNDAEPGENPGETERCGDGVDNDCVGGDAPCESGDTGSHTGGSEPEPEPAHSGGDDAHSGHTGVLPGSTDGPLPEEENGVGVASDPGCACAEGGRPASGSLVLWLAGATWARRRTRR